MTKIMADWDIQLNTTCPGCGEYVDLLDYPDFWPRSLDVCEWGTDRSRDVEVICPECGHEFNVDLEF